MFTVTLARAVLSPWPVFVSCPGLLSLATFTAGLWLVLTLLLAGPGWSSPTGLGLASRAHGPLSTQTPDKPGTCAQCAGGWLVPRVGGDVCGAGDARVEDKSKLNLIHGDIIRKTVFSKDSKRIACSCQRYIILKYIFKTLAQKREIF